MGFNTEVPSARYAGDPLKTVVLGGFDSDLPSFDPETAQEHTLEEIALVLSSYADHVRRIRDEHGDAAAVTAALRTMGYLSASLTGCGVRDV